ncbi:uncharacterized protein LOC123690946 [Colias croceus]|uniref:uncharacterized protein LOC123690946 n=1 Tax=Colias crocea TaxID=72248 RepID=UPI001E27F189|nr:uncharacterized protein LOC123690946 [Colias croceus]
MKEKHITLLHYTFDLYMERVEITYYDQEYVKNASTTVRRYSRKSNPVLNIYGYIEKAWDKNVSIAMVIEEYLHNEYRPSFVRFQFKLCDLFDSPLLDLKKNYGLECPLRPKFYSLTNISISTNTLPNIFPMEQGRVYVLFFITETKHPIVKSYLYTKFVNKL